MLICKKNPLLITNAVNACRWIFLANSNDYNIGNHLFYFKIAAILKDNIFKCLTVYDFL